MEISDEDIAKLVLGYLRSEKCKGAVEPFLQSSRYLRDIPSTVRRSKHFITHIHGYCLTEILREYAKLYTIIIEYMEEATYPNECTNRDMPSKLVYLLENAKRALCSSPSMSPRSRSSTPIKQHGSAVNRPKRRMSHNLSAIEEVSATIACDVNATPLHELPGHATTDNVDATNRKYGDKEDESDITDNVEDKDDEEGSITQVLAETLLENKELQKKLVDNINSVMQKPLGEHTGCNASESIINNELNSAIKAIVHKTEHDPVFERLLSDLIGPNECESGPDEQENRVKDLETHHTTTNEILTAEVAKSSPPVVKKQMITIEGTKVDAVTKPNLTVNTNTGDVILYDGTLENYMKEPSNSVSGAPSVSSVTSSNVVLNTGLLMVQPPIVQQPQSYYVWNGSQIVNVSVPQYKVNNLSEQDILTMPTVIVCDENQQVATAVAATKPSGETPKHLKKIVPRQTIQDGASGTLTTSSLRSTKKKKAPKKATPKPAASKNLEKIQIKVLKHDEEKLIEVKQEVTDDGVVSKDPLQTGGKTNKDVGNDRGDGDNAEPNLNADVSEGASEGGDKNKVNLEGGEDCKNKRTPKQVTPKAKAISNSQKGGTSTPKSGSHVRALDFNFNTPGHRIVTKKHSATSPNKKSPTTKSNQGKISKSLFGTPSKSERKPTISERKAQNVGRSWDADLRALAAAGPSKSQSPRKKKPPKRKPKKKESLNKTEQDGKTIEENLKSGNETSEQKIDPEKSGELEEKKPMECIQVIIQNDAEETGFNEEHDLPFTLVNCNRAPRIKRKCNIDGNLKKEVKVTKVKEVKNLEICSNKMILSPSKLNANKRSLVENKNEDNNKSNENKTQGSSVEDKKVPLTPSVYGGNNFGENEVLTLNFEKNVTPENVNTENHEPVLKANRNLLPLLETPIKKEVIPIPKTPSIISPINTKDTPLTKIFKEHLEGVDLTSIQTPKFPITPNLAITPFSSITYENRPTDYSTSSSYYQPSDTEQNKSLEQLREDSKKENDRKITKSTKNTENKGKNDEKEENPKTMENTETVETTITTIVNKLTSFNKSIIGKKNLSLVSKTDTVSFGDTDSENEIFSGLENINDPDFEETSPETTDSETSENSWDPQHNKNVTVIQNNNNKHRQSRYPLRSRNKVAKTVDKGNVTNEENGNNRKETETITNDDKGKNDLSIANIGNSTNIVKEIKGSDTTKDRASQFNKQKELILLELEKKRLQTIALMKQPTPAPKKKTATKQPNIAKQPTVTKQKSTPKPKPAPKKQITKSATKKETSSTKKKEPTVKEHEHLSLNSDNSNLISPINLVEAHLDSSTSANAKDSKLTESQEDCLIRNLSERGIYLLPNKKKVHLDPPDDNSSTELLHVPNNSSNNNNSTVDTTNSRILPLKKRDSNKSFEIKEDVKKDIPPKIKVAEERNKHTFTLHDDLNLTDSLVEEIPQFDFCEKPDLDFIFVYNPTETSTKTLKDYDFDCLNKSYTADVFVEELNKDIKRVLRVSPMDFVLDIDSTNKNVDSDKVKIINMVTFKKCNPVETLRTKLVPDNTNDLLNKSPLENLYGDSAPKTAEKSRSTRRRKSVEGNKRIQTLTRKSGRSVSVDEQKIKAKSQKPAAKALDLMDYAIIGDEPSSVAPPSDQQGTKRKASEEVASEQSKCPKLCENLLSGLNVDQFLEQIHKN